MGTTIRALFWGSVLFIGTALGHSAHAIEVFSGEYVIEYASPRISETPSVASSSIFPQLKPVRRIGSGLELVRRSTGMKAMTVNGPHTEPYDRSHDLYCEKLLKEGGVRRCSPNFKLKASTTPNDPHLSKQWALLGSRGIGAPDAWNSVTDATHVVVAVLDTGVDLNHPDLINNLWRNEGEIPGNGEDDDENGYIDDLHGINALSYAQGPSDDNGHGSHVAGTIAAEGNNGVGVSGVAWHAQIMALKFLGANGAGSLAGAVEGINYVIEQKTRGVNIRVINASWGGGGYSEILKNAIERASNEGIMVVVAAGNEGNDNDRNPSYPASYNLPNIISVAAIGERGELASFSNRGRASVHIAAPGVDIFSTITGGRYASFSGTSMAAPHVSGALSLLLAKEPSVSIADIRTRVMESGRDLSSLTNATVSGRVLDLPRLLSGERVPVGAISPCSVSSCGASLHDMRIRTISRTSEVARQAKVGARITLSLTGTGNGTILVTPQFDRFRCRNKLPVEMKGGAAAVMVRIPKEAANSRSLSFTSGSVRRSLSLHSTKVERRASLPQSALARVCRTLVSSAKTLEINSK